MCRNRADQVVRMALLLVVVCACVSFTEPRQDDSEHPSIIALSGRMMSSEEVAKLEETLKDEPADLQARTRLLGYYQSAAFRSESARKELQRHVLWIIENRPAAPVAGSPEAGLDPAFDGEAYREAKKLWLEKAQAHDASPAVLGNAANFFLLCEKDTAERLLKQARRLEPDKREWSERLGQLYRLEMIGESGVARWRAALRALTELEKALDATGRDAERFYALPDVAQTAFEAGELEKAERYASELLDKAAQHKDDWNYGNAVHHGNLVLGRLALKSGDLDGAKEYLIRAGKTPGSPQLDSFGPNMTLAKELLEKGERKTVIAYLKLCGSFWEDECLNPWIEVVEAGQMPDFGANLDY